MLISNMIKNIPIFFIFFLFSFTTYAEENIYQAEYIPLICRGVSYEDNETYFASWTFTPTGGSGSELDIRYNGDKRLGKIRTTVYSNGDLYGRGKWIGRTASKTYNTLLTINFYYETKKFILVSLFNPDNFHLEGKCK